MRKEIASPCRPLRPLVLQDLAACQVFRLQSGNLGQKNNDGLSKKAATKPQTTYRIGQDVVDKQFKVFLPWAGLGAQYLYQDSKLLEPVAFQFIDYLAYTAQTPARKESNTGTLLIGRFLGPRKNRLNRNPSYQRSFYGINL